MQHDYRNDYDKAYRTYLRNNETGSQREPWKGLVAGLAGGLAASYVMTQFQKIWNKASEATTPNYKKSSDPDTASQLNQDEDATMKTAEKLAEPVLGRQLTKSEKQAAGPVVHYTFGTLMGAAYGVASELAPVTKTAFGLPYGAALFVAADEVAVPSLGLAKSPSQTPPSTHLYGLVSHLVYGATLETVRRGVRNRL
jgi:putative membrane protein